MGCQAQREAQNRLLVIVGLGGGAGRCFVGCCSIFVCIFGGDSGVWFVFG